MIGLLNRNFIESTPRDVGCHVMNWLVGAQAWVPVLRAVVLIDTSCGDCYELEILSAALRRMIPESVVFMTGISFYYSGHYQFALVLQCV